MPWSSVIDPAAPYVRELTLRMHTRSIEIEDASMMQLLSIVMCFSEKYN